MLRRLLPILALALVAVPTASAQPLVLWPGVTYDTGVEFTNHGPVAIRILTGPRPGGTTTLAPVLSNDTVEDAETLTSMQRRLAPSMTTAGVNGDRKTLATGVPTGIFMSEGQLANAPSDARASIGVTTDGTLEVRRVTFVGTWQGAGARHILKQFNRPLEGGGVALFTQAWGAATPALAGATSVVLFPFPAAIPNTDLVAPALEVRVGGAPVPIPAGGAVLVAKGAEAAALTAEIPIGQLVTSRLLFKPDWPGVVAAVGGGPEIVRDGAAVFRAGELFSSADLGTRSPRTAVGQKADGQVILVAVDGRQPGYSTGLTNFELAQTLVRLGAVTAMSLDGGGSTAMAFNGTLLNRPSDGVERRISTALMFQYTGVFVQPATAVVSPDGDGVGDRQSLRYKLVRPSTVTAKLTAPDGTVAYEQTSTRRPGSYAVAFPPAAPVAAAPTPASRAAATVAAEPVQGRWTLTVAAVDDIGQPSEMSQSFLVNTTVGFLATTPPKLYLPPYGRDLRITWRQSLPAAVVVTVETPAGEVVRTLAKRRYAKGTPNVTWNGLDRSKVAVKGGRYVVRVVAKNTLGTLDLNRNLRVQRIVGR